MNLNSIHLKESVHQILTCGDNCFLMKQSVDRMYSIYRSISEVNADDQNDPHIIVPSGKAISPSMAAHCLLEMKRTAMFIRGIYEAFDRKLEEQENIPIHILYAGTGPYATLVTPLLLLFDPSKIKVDLLDINPVSLNSAVKVLKQLGLEQFVGAVYLADAAVFKAERDYDVVISETMQAALKKEPQVAIMQNLIPQMKKDAIFIPETITVEAAMVSRGKWNAETYVFEDIQRIKIGELMRVDKSLPEKGNFRRVLDFPEKIGECKQLKFYTTIRTFGNHWLLEGDCSLNMPLKVCELDEGEGETITFWYEQGEIPGIHFQFSGSASQYAAIGKTYCNS